MRVTLIIIGLLANIISFAQAGKVLEEIVAVVGENVILKSDLETEYLQAKQQMNFYEGDLKCQVLNQLIIQKMYLHKGEVDSVVVSDERVESEVSRRVQYYASQIGGERQLERYLGKTIEEYKELMRPKVREQMTIQDVQQRMISEVKVSPTQVQAYFSKIPQDSLPTFEKEVELGQISMGPKPSQIAKDYALETLKEIRADIMAGKYTFEYAARYKSDDKGTAVNGGELGYFTRGQMVGAFERVAFKLSKDSISEIVETEFGYHIIQVIDRKGEKVNARHVLIKPLILPSDLEKVEKEMKQLIIQLKTDSTTMCKAASNYSIDPYTKDNCGFYVDPNTGSQNVPISSLDPEVTGIMNSMEVGEYTSPRKFQNYDGTDAYRFFYLKSSSPEHKANLRDDYQKIQKLALAEAQDEYVSDWVQDYKSGVYVWIDEKYRNCSELEGWEGLN
ncbi:MAG: peptidylprolyl isomerase [Bacteroidia bacterium]